MKELQIQKQPLPKEGSRDGKYKALLQKMKPGSDDCVLIENVNQICGMWAAAKQLEIKLTRRTINGKIYIWRTK